MMKRLEWKVGLFVAVGLTLLALLMLQFSKGLSVFKPTYTIHLHSSNATGLKEGAAVLMSGVQVGKVHKIRLAENNKSVTISLKIYSQHTIHKDARFLLEQSGFLGDQFVAIQPTRNRGDVFHDDDTAEAEAAFSMQEIARSASALVERLDETARHMNETIAELRRLVLNEKTLTNLSTTVANARVISEKGIRMVDNVNALIESNAPTIGYSASNLAFFSERITGTATALDTLIETNSAGIVAAISNIESSTTTLKSLMEEVQAGKGLAGHLIKNEQLANNVIQVSSNLSITTSNLNRLGLWGILWKRKAPRPEPPPSSLKPLVAPKNLTD